MYHPDIECPYCGHEFDDTADMYKTDTSYEVECYKCEKLYYVQVEYDTIYRVNNHEEEEEKIARQAAMKVKIESDIW